MRNMEITEAQKHLAEVLERVASSGVSVLLTQGGQPIAEIVPTKKAKIKGHLADAKGWLENDDEFFDAIKGIVTARHRHKAKVLHFDE